MCDRLVPRQYQTTEKYGLYHSPDVSTETFERGYKAGVSNDPKADGRGLDVGCVCGNPMHRFVPGPDGWERNDIVLKEGERIFIWPN